MPASLAALVLAALMAVLLGRGAAASAQEYPTIYKSARFLERGGTGIAVPEEEEPLFFDPAGLAFRAADDHQRHLILVSPLVEVSAATVQLAREVNSHTVPVTEEVVSQIGKPQHVAAYNFSGFVFQNFSFGAFEEAATTALFSKEQQFRAVETLTVAAEAAKGLVAGFGNMITPELGMGISVKYLQRTELHAEENIVDAAEREYSKKTIYSRGDLIDTGTGLGADAGFLWRGRSAWAPSAAITADDIGQTYMAPEKDNGNVHNLKQTLNLGLAMKVPDLTELRLMADFNDLLGAVEPDVIKRTHFGTELSLDGQTGLAAGLNQGYPALGAFLGSRLLRLDAGAYSEEIGEWAGRREDRRYFAKITLGF